LDGDPDEELVERHVAQLVALVGAKASVVQVVVQNVPVPGVSIEFPRAVLSLPLKLPHVAPRFSRRVFREYFAGLGYGWREGSFHIVPTPTTLTRATEILTGEKPHIDVRLLRGALGAVRPSSWVRSIVVERVLAIRIAPDWLVELHATLGRVMRMRLFAMLEVDAGALLHDMALHGLAWHAIPSRFWKELLPRAASRLDAPEKLARFFEEALTRTAWEVWNRIESPAEFPDAFIEESELLAKAL
jgi:hypothetical protein